MIAGILTTIVLLSIIVWESLYADLNTGWPDGSRGQHALIALTVPVFCVAAGGVAWIVSGWLS